MPEPLTSRIPGIRILGSGHALPAGRVSSQELDRRHGLPPGYLAQASGVQSRYFAAAEDQISLACDAGRKALENAARGPEDIDLIIGACAVPFQPLPATAPLVMQRLGLRDGAAAAFDVNASCLSFLNALELAANKIALGQSRTALVFSSELASRALPWQDQPEVAALFGDGAAAVVLGRAETQSQGIAASLMRSYPSHYDTCSIGSGGTRIDYHNAPQEFARHAVFRMQGKALFRATHMHFPQFLQDALAQAGWRMGDLDLVVPHQASPLALQHMKTRTGLRPDQVIDISTSHGNQIAASLPTALDIALRSGRITSGSRVLLAGTSAGLSFGALAMEF
jgi:3-oxoacyl-[acyl-carrier-protein] synthase-3